MSTRNQSVESGSLSVADFKYRVKQAVFDPKGLYKPRSLEQAIVSGVASAENGKRGDWTGVYAYSAESTAIYAMSPVWAGYFNGDVQIRGDLIHDSGVATFTNVTVSGDIMMANADCAEDFDVDQQSPGEPGTVMVVGDAGVLQPGRLAYDKRVAGVISGAGDFKPGMVFDKRPSQRSRQPIALLGKVYCKVDAHYAPIEVGDLLTTSCTLGHGMKAIEPLKAFGAVIGKALRPLLEGQGLIPILIALQ
jgi:hypothetical protein